MRYDRPHQSARKISALLLAIAHLSVDNQMEGYYNEPQLFQAFTKNMFVNCQLCSSMFTGLSILA